jgi:hypothetical protein
MRKLQAMGTYTRLVYSAYGWRAAMSSGRHAAGFLDVAEHALDGRVSQPAEMKNLQRFYE